MADYRELLRRAVDALPENNGAARRQVYEKARNALVTQLRAIEPPLPAREITQHRLQLEDCIREVEQAATEDLLAGARAEEEAAAKAKANPAPVVAKPEPVVEPEPVAEPEPAPEVAAALEPEPEPEVVTEPEPAPEPEVKAEPATAAPEEEKPEAEAKAESKPKAKSKAKTAAKAKSAEAPQEELAVEDKDAEKTKSEAETKPEAETESQPEAEASEDEKANKGEADTQPENVETPEAAAVEPVPVVVAQKPAPKAQAAQQAIEIEEPDPQSLSNTKASEAAIQQLIEEAASDSASVKPIEPPTPDTPTGFDTPKRPSAPVADLKIDMHEAKSDAPPISVAPQVVAMSADREVDLDPVSGEIDMDSDAQSTVDRAIETLDREARGVDSAPVEPEPQKPVEIKRAKPAAPKFEREEIASGEGGGGVTIFLIVLAFLIVAASGAGFWAWREGYVDLDAMFGQSDSVAQTDEAAPVVNAGPGNTASAPDAVAPVAQELGKSDERLPGASTAESTPATAEPAPTPAPDSGTKTDERLTPETSFAQAEPGATTADDSAPAAATANAPVAVAASGAQSLLLEASNEGTTGAVPFSGSVEWTRGIDELGQPTLKAKANIPARNLSVDVLIRRNADQTLPASHLIEVDFSVSDSFIGGAVASLPGILLKNEELVRGVPLVGASARVVGNSFLFALSASPQDLNANMQLLGSRKWMDLALIYATSTRAIITLEKDAAAQKLFDEVMAVWAEADKDAAASAVPAAN